MEKKGGDPSLQFIALSHSHIDLAWLWPIRETRRKGGRTFANVLRMMDQYDDFMFGASQPQLYEWISEDYPDIMRQVRERIKEGRWEVQGGMWVESDTNVPSGESLVRQFLYGKRYFLKEFGQEIRNLWMPDVFGYSGALPQIMKKAGVDYFMTTKLAFNEFTRFPHHTFLWEGIDGTRVLTHMLPEGTYNGPMTPRSIKHAERNYQERGICEEGLILYGVGDGGGGPGEEHIERMHRMRNLDGLCPMKHGFAQDLFERLDEHRDRYDVYKGELYFERHQGTYTTQCKNKWFNRKLEFAFHNLEFLLAMLRPDDYPAQEPEKMWKEFLLYQFHDILPGSSINRVYDESVAGYQKIADRLEEMTREACAQLGDGPVAVNALSWDRSDLVQAGGRTMKVSAPALSAQAAVLEEVDVSALRAEGLTLENEALRVRFSEDGSIASVYSKTLGRETLREGTAGNRLSVWDDQGDCWDIPLEYRYLKPQYFTLTGQEARIEDGMAVMEQVYTFGDSTVRQKVCLEAGKPYVDFRTFADWREDRRMLRTAFDVDILADNAAYEIQFGYIRRPVNDNNIYEMAKFEVCGHKWADLSQSDCGVALLNDCKYGYRVKDSVMELDLLRAQNFPGVGADRGTHEFRYALYPHAGDTGNSDVARIGYEYNNPLRVLPGGGGHDGSAMFRVEGGLFLDTVKRAEEQDGTVLRFYEPFGAEGVARVKLARPYGEAVYCDLLERGEAPAEVQQDELVLPFKPFELITVKLTDSSAG